MNKYYQLSRIFNMGSNYEEEYEKRINDLNTYTTSLKIFPIKKGKVSKEEYPLFLVNFKELNKIVDIIVRNSYSIQEKAKKLPLGAEFSFLKTLLINELQSTNEIENVRSTKKELSQILSDIESEKENTTYKKFEGLVNLYLNLSKNFEKQALNKVEDIRKIYDILVSMEIKDSDRLDGELFRKNEVGIYSASSNEYLHKGVMPETNIILKLAEMLNFLNNDDMPELYKIMVVHYFFEYIHPFYDGNGRVGRYILGELVAKHLDIYSAITFSYMVNRNRNKYYKAFESASDPFNRGEISFFVYDMLTFIKEGQDEVIEYLDSIILKYKKLDNALENIAQDEITHRILKCIAMNTLFPSDVSLTLKRIAELLSLSRTTLDKKIKVHLNNMIYISKKPVTVVFSERFIKELLNE